MADYYTKYYISVVSALWATTFSLFILFLPILLAFFRQQKREQQKTQRSQQQSLHHQTSSTSTAETSMHSQQRHMPLLPGDLVAVTDASHPSLSSGFTTQSPHTPTSHHGPSSYHATLSSLPPHLGRHGHGSSKNDAIDAIGLPLDEHDALATELLSLDEILGSGAPVLRSDDATSMRQRLTELAPGQFLYEGNVPVRKVFRYLPWLAPWQMVHLMAFPGLGYITTISVQFKRNHAK
ncbi:hypothetical protein BC940DRAFT_7581 [Gongronella butleri]|nr:hypothetical protein BC940DRAFT_7581 [Gongronella butleri]